MKRLATAVIAALSLAAMLLPASAMARDRNHDRLPDQWEKHHHLSLSRDQSRRDQDRDGLRIAGGAHCEPSRAQAGFVGSPETEIVDRQQHSWCELRVGFHASVWLSARTIAGADHVSAVTRRNSNDLSRFRMVSPCVW